MFGFSKSYYCQARKMHWLINCFVQVICIAVVVLGCVCRTTNAQTAHFDAPAITNVQRPLSPTLTALSLIIIQVDESSDENASTPENNTELNCMQAKATLRNFENISWILTVALAFLIYYLWLVMRPRWLKSGAKWAISPIISSILVAKTVASFENFQFTRYCNQISEWRFAKFATTFVIHCFIVFAFFVALAIYRKVRRTRRLTLLENE